MRAASISKPSVSQQKGSMAVVKEDIQGQRKFSGAWYLPVNKWGDIKKYPHEGKEISTSMPDPEKPEIGSLTKHAIQYLITPFKEGVQKKNKLNNRTDETITGGSSGL